MKNMSLCWFCFVFNQSAHHFSECFVVKVLLRGDNSKNPGFVMVICYNFLPNFIKSSTKIISVLGNGPGCNCWPLFAQSIKNVPHK